MAKNDQKDSKSLKKDNFDSKTENMNELARFPVKGLTIIFTMLINYNFTKNYWL